mmetsp:Transcript_13759/g.55187  ORF Transcript_13759/g.55187 Transcript_13759/m.55187 type:complete len:82 (+) Transcript_13759:9222-9467(+)
MVTHPESTIVLIAFVQQFSQLGRPHLKIKGAIDGPGFNRTQCSPGLLAAVTSELLPHAPFHSRFPHGLRIRSTRSDPSSAI